MDSKTSPAIHKEEEGKEYDICRKSDMYGIRFCMDNAASIGTCVNAWKASRTREDPKATNLHVQDGPIVALRVAAEVSVRDFWKCRDTRF